MNALERNALLLFWTTLRNNLQPDLTSALARDRAQRADAAILRLVAGYDHLHALRARFAGQYADLLHEARALGAEEEADAGADIAGGVAALDDNVAFIGVPAYAGALEQQLIALARNSGYTGEDVRFDRLLGRVMSAESALRADYEVCVASVKPVGARAALPVTAETFERYLREHRRVAPKVRVRSLVDLPGGRSKRTLLVDLENCRELPPALVLRMDTDRGVGTNVSDEYPLLARLMKLGLPVAEPLWFESDPQIFGFPFIAFRRMPGAAAGDLMEGALKKVPETGRALARALGAVHAAGAALIEDPAMRGSAIPHTEALLKHYHDWWLAKKPFPSITVEAAFIWLRRNLRGGLGQATLVHADTAFHNMLLDERGTPCLLDWEFAHFGDGAEDLASCRPAVERCMPWGDFLKEYYASGGNPVTDFQLKYFDVWRPLRNAVLCGTVMHSLVNGEADEIDPVTIALSTFARLQADLAKTLASIAGAAAPGG